MLTPLAKLPQIVEARSPFDRKARCFFRIAATDALKGIREGRREPLYLFWSVLMGEPPPGSMPVEEHILLRLADAHACFSGLRRPVGNDQSGKSMVAYILKPSSAYTYWFVSAEGRPYYVPAGVVFAVYARLDWPMVVESDKVIGVVTHWEFVPASTDDEWLPSGWEDRYDNVNW